ncbi:MAG: anthranilate phosphoribosyltransferase [bacterium]
MLQQIIQKIVDRKNLTREEAFDAMEFIMKGEATPAQIAAYLVGLRMKGETPQEIAGCASSMRKNALPVDLGDHADAVDLVGTGGDGKHTFNISTVASLVVAGTGAPVAKHGNRSVSSKCGSADVLIELGVNLNLNNVQLSQCLQETGIAFLFAPMLHPAMKHAIGPRREIGVRSVFNILGPISNPAGVKRQLIGVYDKSLLRLLAEVLQQLDSEHIMLVHSADGMDEISLAGETYVAELQEGRIKEYQISPKSFGLRPSDASITGGDAKENAEIAVDILQGKSGPARDIVLANAAAGIYVAGRSEDLREGAALAANSIDSGAAMAKLKALRDFTKNVNEPGRT